MQKLRLTERVSSFFILVTVDAGILCAACCLCLPRHVFSPRSYLSLTSEKQRFVLPEPGMLEVHRVHTFRVKLCGLRCQPCWLHKLMPFCHQSLSTDRGRKVSVVSRVSSTMPNILLLANILTLRVQAVTSGTHGAGTCALLQYLIAFIAWLLKTAFSANWFDQDLMHTPGREVQGKETAEDATCCWAENATVKAMNAFFGSKKQMLN